MLIRLKISDDNKCVLYGAGSFPIIYQICDDYCCQLRGLLFSNNVIFIGNEYLLLKK